MHRSPAELTRARPDRARDAGSWPPPSRSARRRRPIRARPPAAPDPPAAGEPLTASHVLAALAERLPRNAVVLEEAPVDRPDIHERLPAREPLGYLSAAQGGLGFALPAAAGVKMALPDRPVVAVVGDGSALYGVHAGWSAVHYGVGPLWVVLSNGGYVVMDRLAEKHGRRRGAVARRSARSSWRRSRAGSAARPAGSPRTTSWSPTLDEVVPDAGRRAPSRCSSTSSSRPRATFTP